MSEKSRFQLGELVANRYQLMEQVNENDDYVNYICQYDGWNFFAKIYFGGIKVNEEIFDIIKSLGSTNICRVIDSGIYKNRFCIVRPFYNNGNIMQIAPVHYEYLLKEFIPIVNEALHEIHQAGIIHGKITPGNIFYSDFGNDIVLGEFGISLCQDCEEEGAFYSESQYIEFLPPEAVNGIVTKEADYYALGITIYCLVTGVKPYLNMEKNEVLKAIYTEELPIPDSVNPIIAKFIRGLTVKAKEDRWGYEEIVRALNGEDVEIKDSFVCDMSFFEDEFENDFNDDIAEPLDSHSPFAENAVKEEDTEDDVKSYNFTSKSLDNPEFDDEMRFMSYLETEESKEENKQSENNEEEKSYPNLEDTIIYNFKSTELSQEEEEKIDEAAKYAVKGILSGFEENEDDKASEESLQENVDNSISENGSMEKAEVSDAIDEALVDNPIFADFIVKNDEEIGSFDDNEVVKEEDREEPQGYIENAIFLEQEKAEEKEEEENKVEEFKINETAEEDNALAENSYTENNVIAENIAEESKEEPQSYIEKATFLEQEKAEEKAEEENKVEEFNINETAEKNNAFAENSYVENNVVAENIAEESKEEPQSYIEKATFLEQEKAEEKAEAENKVEEFNINETAEENNAFAENSYVENNVVVENIAEEGKEEPQSYEENAIFQEQEEKAEEKPLFEYNEPVINNNENSLYTFEKKFEEPKAEEFNVEMPKAEDNFGMQYSANNIPNAVENPFRTNSVVAENPFKENKANASTSSNVNNIPIEELISKRISDNGIKFINEIYYDATTLVKAFLNNWEAAKDLLYDEKVYSYFKHKDANVARLAKICVDHDDKDLGLFRFIYEVNPKQVLCYKGVFFYDLIDISEGILLSENTELYREMLINGVLSFYFIKNNQYQKAEKIIPLEDMAREGIKNIDLIICIMLYTLSDDPVFIFDNKSFRTVDELVDYLDENDAMVDSICSRLMGDTAFYGWIEFLGYGEVLSRFI